MLNLLLAMVKFLKLSKSYLNTIKLQSNQLMHTNPIHATADLQLHHRIKPKLSSSKSYTLTIQWQLSAKCLHGSVISSQEVLKLYILSMAMVNPSRSSMSMGCMSIWPHYYMVWQSVDAVSVGHCGIVDDSGISRRRSFRRTEAL